MTPRRKRQRFKRPHNTSQKTISDHAAYFGSMSDVESKDVDWLWYPYIPYHGLTLIAGEPAHGKSFLTMDLTAIVSNQDFWPLSTERPPGDRVLILSSEDDDERAISPRLDSVGAYQENVRYMKKYRKLDKLCLALLRYEINQFRPDLLIIDTISSYMGAGTDMNKQVEVQDFLVQLTDIAKECRVAVVVVAHLNKKVGEAATHRINGSVGFVAGVRSVVVVGTDPENPEHRAFAHAKSNWGPKGRTLMFKLEGGGRNKVPDLKWIGESNLSADDICKAAKNPAHRPRKEREEAQQFIITVLELNGPATWTQILKLGEKSGYSKSTLNRARKELVETHEVEKSRSGQDILWGLVMSEGKED
ncbi:MAG: AAA family ATPase [Alphaproteobacteria bacterium]